MVRGPQVARSAHMVPSVAGCCGQHSLLQMRSDLTSWVTPLLSKLQPPEKRRLCCSPQKRRRRAPMCYTPVKAQIQLPNLLSSLTDNADNPSSSVIAAEGANQTLPTSESPVIS